MDKLGPYLLGPNDENQGVYTGDAKELALMIPDESIDLIFTDPVYQKIGDYHWLAETATRVLKPNSACLCYAGIGYLPETHQALLNGGLSYHWRLVVRPLFGAGSGQWHGRLQAGTKEILWYEKGKSRLYQAIFDLLTVSHGERAGLRINGSTWGKALAEVSWYISSFSKTNFVILDLFAGWCTIPAACKMLGRSWLAFEIDPDTVEMARQRIRQTQPPLFVPQPEQAEMTFFRCA